MTTIKNDYKYPKHRDAINYALIFALHTAFFP